MRTPLRLAPALALAAPLAFAAHTGAAADDAQATGAGAGTPESMAIASPEKTQIKTEDGRVVEPGMRIGADPQVSKALGRLDTAQDDLARLAQRFADAPPTAGQPEETELGQYAQDVIGQAFLAVEALEHSDVVEDSAQIIQDTRLQLTKARRALAEDNLAAAPEIAQAAEAVGTLEDQVVQGLDVATGAAQVGD